MTDAEDIDKRLDRFYKEFDIHLDQQEEQQKQELRQRFREEFNSTLSLAESCAKQRDSLGASYYGLKAQLIRDILKDLGS